VTPKRRRPRRSRSPSDHYAASRERPRAGEFEDTATAGGGDDDDDAMRRGLGSAVARADTIRCCLESVMLTRPYGGMEDPSDSFRNDKVRGEEDNERFARCCRNGNDVDDRRANDDGENAAEIEGRRCLIGGRARRRPA